MNNYLEWFGYIASLVVLISLLTSSIIKLRWINLVGALLFSIYGLLLGSIPVAVMNAGIVLIDIYYLIKIYTTKEYFHLLELTPDSNYFIHFIEFFKPDLEEFFQKSDFKVTNDMVGFYVLRNTVTAGVFLASKRDDGGLDIELDFAVKEYRDYKTSKFVYEENKDFFINNGYNHLYVTSTGIEHNKYLTKIGFVPTENENEYIKKFN